MTDYFAENDYVLYPVRVNGRRVYNLGKIKCRFIDYSDLGVEITSNDEWDVYRLDKGPVREASHDWLPITCWEGNLIKLGPLAKILYD